MGLDIVEAPLLTNDLTVAAFSADNPVRSTNRAFVKVFLKRGRDGCLVQSFGFDSPHYGPKPHIILSAFQEYYIDYVY